MRLRLAEDPAEGVECPCAVRAGWPLRAGAGGGGRGDEEAAPAAAVGDDTVCGGASSLGLALAAWVENSLSSAWKSPGMTSLRSFSSTRLLFSS